jgi:NAD(P)-dependent dehydrogenase (short-subunit alcohol dehydrogenase family)
VNTTEEEERLAEDFEGRVAFVTGAAMGIGLATVERFAARGCQVALADIADNLEETARAFDNSGSLAIRCDLRSRESVDAAVEAAVRRFGRIDILANVAGVYPFSDLVKTEDAFIDEMFEVNVKGVMRTCRAVLPHMLAQGSGSIVNVSSGAARKGLHGLTAYSASKGAVEAFTRALAVEVGPTVRANIVAPGVTGSPKVRASLRNARGGVDAVSRGTPLRRIAEPEEIADAIVFLSSDQASFITGETLSVNGGSLMT